MKFAVVGTGGVGGYFGGMLAQGGEDVWFLARGQHLEAIRTDGLHLRSFGGNWAVPPAQVTGHPEDVGEVEVVLFCVKSYDTETAAKQMEPLLSRNTLIISLQNGVDNAGKIRNGIRSGAVYPGVAYIYATITSPGTITHTVGPTKIVFGPDADMPHPYANEALNRMLKAGINATLAEDITSEVWKKYIFIASVGGMTALTRLPLGDILRVTESREMLEESMKETDAIARAKGVSLPAGFVDQIFELLKKYDNNSRSSLYHDLVHERPMELEAFSGNIIRFGKELGIPTPVHGAMYASLLPHHIKHVRKRAS